MLYKLLQVYFTISDLEIMPAAPDKSSKHARNRTTSSSREKSLVESLTEGSPVDFWAVPQSDREVCYPTHTCYVIRALVSAGSRLLPSCS
jgi:hypothetical protein